MTRDEALEELLNCENEYGLNPSDVYAVVSKIYDELEALQARNTCEGCKWYEPKRCMNTNSIAYNGDNAVYEDDFCKDYEQKDKE